MEERNLRKEKVGVNERHRNKFDNTQVLDTKELTFGVIGPETEVETIKQWCGADTAFKKDGMLYFCIKIEDLEIIN